VGVGGREWEWGREEGKWAVLEVCFQRVGDSEWVKQWVSGLQLPFFLPNERTNERTNENFRENEGRKEGRKEGRNVWEAAKSPSPTHSLTHFLPLSQYFWILLLPICIETRYICERRLQWLTLSLITEGFRRLRSAQYEIQFCGRDVTDLEIPCHEVAL